MLPFIHYFNHSLTHWLTQPLIVFLSWFLKSLTSSTAQWLKTHSTLKQPLSSTAWYVLIAYCVPTCVIIYTSINLINFKTTELKFKSSLLCLKFLNVNPKISMRIVRFNLIFLLFCQPVFVNTFTASIRQALWTMSLVLKHSNCVLHYGFPSFYSDVRGLYFVRLEAWENIHLLIMRINIYKALNIHCFLNRGVLIRNMW